MLTEAMLRETIQQPEPMVGWVPAHSTIFAESVLFADSGLFAESVLFADSGLFAESVAISGEALLIGLVVLLVLAVLGVAVIAGLVYLGAHLMVRFSPRNPQAPSVGPSPEDTIAAVPYDPSGKQHRIPRSRRRPLAIWQWILCTVVSAGVVVALPGVWYLGPLAAPLLGAAASRIPVRAGG